MGSYCGVKHGMYAIIMTVGWGVTITMEREGVEVTPSTDKFLFCGKH